jgi:hypothetical protein
LSAIDSDMCVIWATVSGLFPVNLRGHTKELGVAILGGTRFPIV